MNFLNLCIFWGLGNLLLGGMISNMTLSFFGAGIMLGGLCVSIEHDRFVKQGERE